MTNPRRLVHLTTVDMSLALLLSVELVDACQAGWEVYAVSAPGPDRARIEATGATFVAVEGLSRSWDLRADLRALRDLLRVLRELSPDVLHTHTPKAGVLGRVAGRLLGVPVLVNTCHGLFASRDDRWERRLAVLAAEGLAAMLSDVELYQGPDDRDRLAWAVSSRRSRLVGNGIDLARFRPDDELRQQVRRQLGVAPEDVLVGGVGRFTHDKGVAELAAAARAVADRARVVWVGPREDDGQIDPGPVELLGPRSDVEAFYNAMDVFVLPTHREGFSRAGMEAAATGCAMALSDIPGCRVIGEHDRELLLVPPRRPDLLAQALGRMVDDAALRDRLGQAAEKRARSLFDQHAVTARSREAYRAVAHVKRLGW